MTLARAATAEAAGTFLLVLFGPGAMMVDAWSGGTLGHVGVSLAFGGIVTVAILMFGPVSGAHINPAVTIALWRSGRFPAARVPAYVAAQCLGAALAAVALRAVLGTVGNLGATLPALPLVPSFAVELVLSASLMLAVLSATAPGRQAGVAALTVGLTVGLCCLVGGPLTGASMNPARSLGPAIAGGIWTHHWLYWAAPLVGMLAMAEVAGRPKPDTA